MPKLTNSERAAIDLMDAYLQLLLALTWQNMQSDGVGRLIELKKLVTQKLEAYPHVFNTEHERSIATMRILNSLQDERRRLELERPNNMLHQWTTIPSNIDLPSLHRKSEYSFFKTAKVLVSAARARIHVDSGVTRPELTNWISEGVSAMAEDLGVPLYVPALIDLTLYLANLPGGFTSTILRNELSLYWQVAERLAENKELIIRSMVVSELKASADDISLRIDQSYSWADLASFAKETSLKALGWYTQLNLHGRVQDGHFSSNIVSKKAMPSADFESVSTPWFIRGLTFMMSGDDHDTRRVNRYIVDTERADVRVKGRRVSNSLMLLVPYEDSRELDIEHQLAVFLFRLNRVMSDRHDGLNKPMTFLEGLSPDLRQFAENHYVRRKIIHTKKELLFCLASLIAENIYRYRDKNNTILSDGRPLRTRTDADEFTIALLKEHGFHYKAETLRRGRSRFRRDFLERVPAIFGLDELESNDKYIAQ
jgi:hypothetical protein